MLDPLAAIRTVDPDAGVLVAVSGGKDSVAVLDVCCQHFKRVEAYHLYVVPGIGFVDRYLDYLERRFGVKIARRPGQSLSHYLRQGLYRATCVDVPAIKNAEIEADEMRRTGCLWRASGEKKADSLDRRAMISSWGPVATKWRRLFPLAEWSEAQVYNHLRRRGIPLSAGYRFFNANWDSNLSGRHLAVIRRQWPEDYAKIKRYFPLVDAEADRWEMFHGEEEKAARDFAGNRRGAPARRKRKPDAPGAGTDPLPDVPDDAAAPVDAQPSGLQPAHD